MSILVGKSYQDIRLDGATELILTPKFTGPIRPGALKGLVKIRFHDEYNCELEPGVITDEVTTLVLGKGYKHKLGPDVLPASTKVYLHDDNREFAPSDRPFVLYRFSGDGTIDFTSNEHANVNLHPAKYATPDRSFYQHLEKVMDGVILWTMHITPKALVAPVTKSVAVVEPVIEPVSEPNTAPEPATVPLAASEPIIAPVPEPVSDIEALRQELAQANLKIDALTATFDQRFNDLKKLILATGGFL